MSGKVVKLADARPKPKTVKVKGAPLAAGAKVCLTATIINAALPAAKRYWIADTDVNGLAVAVEPSGNKMFYARGRMGIGRGAKWRDIRIGEVGVLVLPKAREKARELLVELKSGRDPRVQDKAPATMMDVVEDYEADMERREVVNRKAVSASLRRGLRRLWTLPIEQVTRMSLVQTLETVADTAGPSAATSYRAFLSAALNNAANKGVISANPLAGYKAPRKSKAQRVSDLVKKRPVLKGREEVRAFWEATDAAHDPTFAAMLKFLLLSGQRGIEVASMEWDQLDLKAKRWTVPASVRKTGVEHIVPLGPLSQEVIGRMGKYSPLVFTGRGGKIIAGSSKRLRPVKEALGRPDVAYHTCRRTYRTALAELGVSDTLSEVMLGHRRQGLEQAYNHADLWQRRVAVQNEYEAWVQEAIA
ncbi:tyrosine-type recombinase/integrase [Falsihalocynthiibacter sp. S25ZX9]|uniref:tyrosine-type recombinase/integrase n=1 Tax=Falsihalocynthiibacter sp. S25ZX9 TaxID=3240870 RepID=UPI00350F673A